MMKNGLISRRMVSVGAVVVIGLASRASSLAAATMVDFAELGATAVITETPSDFGLSAYDVEATDTLPDGSVFELTMTVPEGFQPSFAESLIRVFERNSFIGLDSGTSGLGMMIELSGRADTTGGVRIPSDIIVSVTERFNDDFTPVPDYFGPSEGFYPAGFYSIAIPRQTITRGGSTRLGSFGRVSSISLHSITVVPEPASGLLVIGSLVPLILCRRRSS